MDVRNGNGVERFDGEPPAGELVRGWRATSLMHRPVVNVRRVEQMGHVEDVVFDPRQCLVAGLLVRSSGREGTPLDLLRRAFGGTMGLTFVDLNQVLALHDAIVTVDPERPAALPGQRTGPMPRLSLVMGFEVVTIRGHRLGRFTDLLLHDEGREIVGYLVQEREAGEPSGQTGGVTQAAPVEQDGQPQPDIETGAAQPPAAPEPPHLLAVPAMLNVRVGHDLMVVAGDLESTWRDDRSTSELGQVGSWSDETTQPSETAAPSNWEADTSTR